MTWPRRELIQSEYGDRFHHSPYPEDAEREQLVVSANHDDQDSSNVREIFDFGDGTPLEGVIGIDVMPCCFGNHYICFYNTPVVNLAKDNLPTDGVIIAFPRPGTINAPFPRLMRRKFDTPKSFRFVAVVTGGTVVLGTDQIMNRIRMFVNTPGNDTKAVTVTVADV